MMVLRGRTPVSVLQRLQCVYKTSTFDLLETAHSPASNPCKQNGNQFWSSALQGRSENLDGSVCLSSPQVPRSACVQEQTRQHSQIAASSEETFTYQGPLSQTLKNLKRLSITGCALSIFGSPLLVWGTAEAMPFAAQASICVTIAGFGVFTTSLLHWFTSPYVHHLNYDRKTRQIHTSTLNIFAQICQSSFNENDVRYPDTMRPQVTFEVNRKFFYLDPNAFEDKDLLLRLTPTEAGTSAAIAEDNRKE